MYVTSTTTRVSRTGLPRVNSWGLDEAEVRNGSPSSARRPRVRVGSATWSRRWRRSSCPRAGPRLVLVASFHGGGAAVAKLRSWLGGWTRFALLCVPSPAGLVVRPYRERVLRPPQGQLRRSFARRRDPGSPARPSRALLRPAHRARESAAQSRAAASKRPSRSSFSRSTFVDEVHALDPDLTVHVVANAPAVDERSPPDPTDGRIPGRILCVGSFVGDKGVDVLVEATSRIAPDFPDPAPRAGRHGARTRVSCVHSRQLEVSRGASSSPGGFADPPWTWSTPARRSSSFHREPRASHWRCSRRCGTGCRAWRRRSAPSPRSWPTEPAPSCPRRTPGTGRRRCECCSRTRRGRRHSEPREPSGLAPVRTVPPAQRSIGRLLLRYAGAPPVDSTADDPRPEVPTRRRRRRCHADGHLHSSGRTPHPARLPRRRAHTSRDGRSNHRDDPRGDGYHSQFSLNAAKIVEARRSSELRGLPAACDDRERGRPVARLGRQVARRSVARASGRHRPARCAARRDGTRRALRLLPRGA